MRLNTLRPAEGSKQTAKRVGRGIGSGFGKTCGKGHKGQKARSGGYHKVGFEGGQMPIQRRVPKFGFTSRKSLVTQEVRLHELSKIQGDIVDMVSLQAVGLIKNTTQYAKIVLSGELERKLTVQGIPVTKGAKAAIEKAGGKVGE